MEELLHALHPKMPVGNLDADCNDGQELDPPGG